MLSSDRSNELGQFRCADVPAGAADCRRAAGLHTAVKAVAVKPGVRLLRRETQMSLWFTIPICDAFVAAFLTMFATASAGAAVNPSATVIGTVTLTAADGGMFSGEGVRVMLTCAADGTTGTEVSDEHGAFRFLNVPVDRCSIEADVQGFVAPPVSVVTVAGQVVATDLHLGIAPLRTGVNVTGTAPVRAPKRLRRSCRSDGRWRFEQPARR